MKNNHVTPEFVIKAIQALYTFQKNQYNSLMFIM